MSATPTSGLPRLLLLLSALGVVGCNDSILCESSPLVMIQSPTSTLSVDVDPVAAGVQTDVRVRSTLLVDEPLELIVLDGSGTEVQRVTKPADVDGAVVFSGVTVPAPHATLHAVGKGACGSGEDEVKIEVIAGSGCELKLEPAPRLIAAYPVGVLNAADDPDPAPGFQAAISVTTLGGWSAELFATTGQGEQSVGKVTADAM